MTHSPIQAPSEERLMYRRGHAIYENGKKVKEVNDPWQILGKNTKSMTPIKTLEEAKKEFENEFVTDEKRPAAVIMEKDDIKCDSESLWNWFESTLSSLTEQMIPEERRCVSCFNNPDLFQGDECYREWNSCVEEMKTKRKELLK